MLHLCGHLIEAGNDLKLLMQQRLQFLCFLDPSPDADKYHRKEIQLCILLDLVQWKPNFQ